ncbi:MAG: type II toxin-antitoxin system HicB family antitoxin [Ruminococcaceae bacterium]|nr:type II toxin-antitoxin system HicB family antitoxin [Oscillospiraceae bacterium]
MAKYVYPAIFIQEESGFSIRFPDFESCYTSAENLSDAIAMSEDVLCLTLYDLEEAGEEIPKVSKIQDIKVSENEFTTLISCDTIEYRKFFDNKAVKKTLTIPSWLNTMAERQNINFSMTLQNALKNELHIN